jgi:hypothetical protein
MRDEVAGGWRKVCNVRNLCFSVGIIGIMKSRMKKWAGHAARMRRIACDSASIISIVSKWRLSVLSSVGKHEEVGWGDDSHVVFGNKKSLLENGSVRRCVVLMQQSVLLLTKLGTKSSNIFGHSP